MNLEIPVEVEQQASKYNLGTPQKRYTRFWKELMYLIVAGITLLISLALFIVAFVFILPSSPVDWKGFGISFAFAIAIGLVSALYMYIGIPPLAFAAYEYSDGFVEFHKRKRSVVHVLRWDTVVRTQVNRSRYGTTYTIMAPSNPFPNSIFSIPYRNIWKRCKLVAKERDS